MDTPSKLRFEASWMLWDHDETRWALDLLGLAWFCLVWLGLALLGMAQLALTWLGLAWLELIWLAPDFRGAEPSSPSNNISPLLRNWSSILRAFYVLHDSRFHVLDQSVFMFSVAITPFPMTPTMRPCRSRCRIILLQLLQSYGKT